MSEVNLYFTIPVELQSYQKNNPTETIFVSKIAEKKTDIGVKFFKKPDGKIYYAAYFSDTGDLIKKVYYDGSTVTEIEHIRNNFVFYREEYESDKLQSKIFYTKDNKISSKIDYKYNKLGKIIAIIKNKQGGEYAIKYGYDDLGRINQRTVIVNSEIINEQEYRFDILDRIIEYSDINQQVKVLQISPNKELIYYTITDRMGNEIVIKNHFIQTKYIDSEITLNGHTISVVDKSYVDNIMLKKPYANEDDLDLIISNIFDIKQYECVTKRNQNSNYVDDIIENKIQPRVLPISIRKRVLYNMSMNIS